MVDVIMAIILKRIFNTFLLCDATKIGQSARKHAESLFKVLSSNPG
jgi:hypothetical protein